MIASEGHGLNLTDTTIAAALAASTLATTTITRFITGHPRSVRLLRGVGTSATGCRQRSRAGRTFLRKSATRFHRCWFWARVVPGGELVGRRPLDVIDHEDVYRSSRRLQFQS